MNWPTAVSSTSAETLLQSTEESANVEEETQQTSEHLKLVENKTANIKHKVDQLKSAYTEYLDAEQDVTDLLMNQKQRINDNGCFDNVNTILTDIDVYSEKLNNIMKRMDSIFDRVEKLQQQAQETKETVTTVPPGNPIPPVSKKVQGSVSSVLEKAKTTMQNTVDSAKSGEMKEKIADSMSNFGEKMSSMMDKAKNTVDNLRK